MKSQGRGASLLEALIVLSLLATLAIILLPVYGGARQHTYVSQCESQLIQIGIARGVYRDDWGTETGLSRLAPHYLPASTLVCPWVRSVAPGIVARTERRWQTANNGLPWHSYFLFNRRGLDDLANRGKSESSFTDIYLKRRGKTPWVACYDHREPVSFLNWGNRESYPARGMWRRPEMPVVVLRLDGSVNTSHYGGLWDEERFQDTMAYLENL